MPEHLRKLRLYKTWEEYTQEVLRTEPVVEGLFLDYGVRCEYYVRRILANNAEFNRLYALKLRYEAMDKTIHGIPELSYEEEVRYRSLGGWDIMKFYAHAYSYFATIDLEEARIMYHVLSREFDLWRTPKDVGGFWAETEALQEFERELRREALRKRGLKKD